MSIVHGLNEMDAEATKSAARIAIAFLTPSRQLKPNSLLPALLQAGERFSVAGRVGKISAVQVGRGPAVLLVHGWEGGIEDFAFLIPVLLGAGFRVVAFDLPAH